MKTFFRLVRLLVITVFLTVCQLSRGAGETNAVYVTDDGHIYLETKNAKWIKPQLIEEAKTNRETWPVEDFPEGNWGALSNGLQLSLRFDKQVYSNGEPIQAIVLVRNTTNVNIVFYDSNEVSLGMANYTAYSLSNQVVLSKPKYTGLRSPSGGGMNVVRVKTQRKFVDCLNKTYDLPTGDYLIQASIAPCFVVDTNFLPQEKLILTNGDYQLVTIPNPTTKTNQPTPFEVKSAKVPIQIR